MPVTASSAGTEDPGPRPTDTSVQAECEDEHEHAEHDEVPLLEPSARTGLQRTDRLSDAVVGGRLEDLKRHERRGEQERTDDAGPSGDSYQRP
jgi:hypothetical protein